jgi:hypothetical protein
MALAIPPVPDSASLDGASPNREDHMARKTVYVVSYHHIDYRHSIRGREAWDDLVSQQLLPCTFEDALAAFKKAGWEGDGSIEALWIPPFMFANPDTMGIHIWHVKQSNNGTSWLCADKPYSFPALNDYGAEWKPVDVG